MPKASDARLHSPLVRRYARALYDLSQKSKSPNNLQEEAEILLNGLKETDLSAFFKNPLIRRNQKADVVDQILKSAKASSEIRKFSKMLAVAGRLYAFADILKAFLSLSAKEQGIETARVVTPFALTPKQRDVLKLKLSQTSGARSLKLEEEVNPELLAGVQITMGSRFYDGSLKTKIEKLHKRLESPAA